MHDRLSDTRAQVVIVLTEEEATALVDLGAALERFVESDSLLDKATAKMDEQLAQQMRGKDSMVRDVADELGEQLYDVPEASLPDLTKVAGAVVDRALGVYS